MFKTFSYGQIILLRNAPERSTSEMLWSVERSKIFDHRSEQEWSTNKVLGSAEHFFASSGIHCLPVFVSYTENSKTNYYNRCLHKFMCTCTCNYKFGLAFRFNYCIIIPSHNVASQKHLYNVLRLFQIHVRYILDHQNGFVKYNSAIAKSI